MEYRKTIVLKNGQVCLLRSAAAADGAAMTEFFLRTHGETEFLCSAPEENSHTAQQEAAFLQEKFESPVEAVLVAVVDGELAGTAGIAAIGRKRKVCHRASFWITVAKAHWGQGIGHALLDACIDCARRAGYEQVELDVVAENGRALALYRSAGFVEYGRNPKGFRLGAERYQELVLMRLELLAEI